VIRVVLPAHLRALARVEGEITVEPRVQTAAGIVDAIEERFPMLRGTIRDHQTGKRRAYVRFFACERDLSHAGLDADLPPAVLSGAEPFLIVGAIAGG
jgi:sulfur-carrier protein